MKASELRLGNYVLRNGFLQEDKENFNKIVVSHNDITACVVASESFQPIPLTEEWFLRFGLLKTKESIILMGCYQIVAHEESWRIILKNGVLSNIKYVHQLQNLYFALIGEELIIKNN